MKIHSCLLPALLLTLGVTLSSAQTVLMDESFNYTPGGDLASPWTVSSASSGSTVTVQTPTSHNGYAPTGNQITIYRPTGGTAPTETLLSGAQSGTSALNLSVGTHLTMTLEMFSPSLTNNQGFVFSLRSATSTFAGFRLYNTTAGGTTLQYMTTNSSTSFTNVASTALSNDVWYKVTLDLTIDSLTQSTMDISLEQMGTGGGALITANDLILTSATNFNTTTAISFYSAISGGNITYSLANLNLDAVPEPSQLSLLIFAAPFFLLFYRRSRFHVSR